MSPILSLSISSKVMPWKRWLSWNHGLFRETTNPFFFVASAKMLARK